MSEKVSKPKPDNVAWAIFFIVGLVLSLAPAMIQSVYALETVVVTRSPSIYWHEPQGGFAFPWRVYESNNSRAYISDGNDETNWGGYHFQDYLNDSLLDFAITKVEYGIEEYRSSGYANEKVSVNNGTIKKQVAIAETGTEAMYWFDITSFTFNDPSFSWNVSMLTDGNLSTAVQFKTGSGCYSLDGEVGLWDGGLKKAGDVKIGDVLTGWNETGNEFIPSTVLNVTIHTKEAPYVLFQIIAENYYAKHDYKDVLVTGDHLLPYFEPDTSKSIEPSKETVKTKFAEEFKIGDFLFGFKEEKYYVNATDIQPAHFEPYRVVSISKQEAKAVIDIQTNTKWFMGHYLLLKKIPWTVYVDWLPMRVTYTYTLPSVSIAPFFIGALVFFALVGLALILALKRKR